MSNLSGDSVWTKAGGGSYDYNFTSVPEPSSFALVAAGALIGMGVLARRRCKH